MPIENLAEKIEAKLPINMSADQKSMVISMGERIYAAQFAREDAAETVRNHSSDHVFARHENERQALLLEGATLFLNGAGKRHIIMDAEKALKAVCQESGVATVRSV